MSYRQHQRVVERALRTNRDLGALFDRLGNRQHPRGQVLSAYRTARRAVKGHVDRPHVVADALDTLEGAVTETLRARLRDARDLGAAAGVSQLAVYGLQPDRDDGPYEELFLAAILAELLRQIAQVRVISLTSRDEALILGDAGHAGLLSPAPVTRSATVQLAALAAAAFAGIVGPALQGGRWVKQAVAVVDGNTTECCLLVNGQTQPLGAPFQLRGSPRFADSLDWSPFHWNCRTSIAVVMQEDANDPLTLALQEQARQEAARRAAEKASFR